MKVHFAIALRGRFGLGLPPVFNGGEVDAGDDGGDAGQ